MMMMMITFNPSLTYRPVVGSDGRVTMEGNRENNGKRVDKAEAKENGDALKEARLDVAEVNKDLASVQTDAVQDNLKGSQELQGNMKGIRELAMPEITAAVSGTPKTTTAIVEDGGDPNLMKQLFGKLFEGGEQGNDMLKNFAGIASTITGKSTEDITKVMDVAGGLFKEGKLDLGNAAEFIGKALGLNEKAVGLIATAYALLSNPFTAGGAAALFQQAMGLITQSKGENKKASEKKKTAVDKQKIAQEQVKKAQEIQQKTAVLQVQIKDAMEKIKNSQILTKDQIEKLVKAKEALKPNAPKPTDANATIAQNKVIPPQQQLALAQPVVPSNPTITPPPVPTTPPSSSIVAFTPPAFTGKF
jgi:hypothetical protein